MRAISHKGIAFIFVKTNNNKYCKSDAPFWMCTLSPVVALVLAGISALVWRRGLRRYNSCGG